MTYEEIITGISSVGFPIVAYMLLHFKLTKSLDKNTEILNSLKDVINKLCEGKT